MTANKINTLETSSQAHEAANMIVETAKSGYVVAVLTILGYFRIYNRGVGRLAGRLLFCSETLLNKPYFRKKKAALSGGFFVIVLSKVSAHQYLP